MKSAQINKYGSSQAIEISNSAPEPSVAPGKVLVAIKALQLPDWETQSLKMRI
jgi:hypothetical protein